MQDDDTLTLEDQYLRLLAMTMIDDDPLLKDTLMSESPTEAVKMFKSFLGCLYDFPPRALASLLVTYRPDVETMHRGLHDEIEDQVTGFDRDLITDTNFKAALASIGGYADRTLH